MLKFAPWDIPFERRLQTLAAGVIVYIVLFSEITAVLLTIYIIRSPYYWIGVLYVIRIANQRNSSNLGLQTWSWVRKWRLWYHLKNYFPIKLVKTVDLDPEQNYLFCVFPHGFISLGSFVNFSTDVSDFKKLFPGMKSIMAILQGHFMVPFFRELVIYLGGIASTKEALEYNLDKKNGTGKCLALIVGGAAESLNYIPGVYKLILKRRKGFVRVAMKNGTPLVPVFSFGETDIYDQFENPEGSFLRRFQDWFQKKTGIAPIMPLGRGFFQYTFGLLPHRRSITTVVGKPIEVARNVDPTPEEVDAVHKKFMEELEKLFEKEKVHFLPNNKDAVLVIS